MSCCSSPPSLNKLFWVLFLIYGVIVLTGGIVFILVEGDCLPDTGQYILNKKDSDQLIPSHLLCNEVRRSLETYNGGDKVGNDRNADAIRKLYPICEQLAESFDPSELNARANCSRWTVDNFVTWFFFASSTVFTIGDGYVSPKSNIGRMIVIIYALIGMPIALSMLAVAGKIVIFCASNIISWFETKYLGREKVTHLYSKVMFIVLLFFFLAIVLGGVITTNDNLEGMPWSFAIYNSFEIMTTIGYGEVPFKANAYHGWKSLILLPYALIMLFGLIMMASFLNLSLKMILKCEWRMLCCCACSRCCKGDEDSDAEEDEGCLCRDLYYDSEEWEGGAEDNKKELEMFLLKK